MQAYGALAHLLQLLLLLLQLLLHQVLSPRLALIALFKGEGAGLGVLVLQVGSEHRLLRLRQDAAGGLEGQSRKSG